MKKAVKSYEGIFAKRTTLCFFIMICLFFSCILRVMVISTGKEYSRIQAEQSSYRIPIKNIRGSIYDSNMTPITNNTKTTYVAIPPTPDAVVATSEILIGEERERVLNELKNNKVAVAIPNGKTSCKSIIYSDIYETDYSDFLCEHIIGYVDSENHGVSGLQKAYDDILYSENGASVVYSVNGKGDILSGITPTFDNDLSVVSNGVISTIDLNLQKIVKEESEGLFKGAVILCDAKTGKIRALVSKPDFDISNLSEYLENEDSPLINRALTPFSVGSVFKPCVAGAAIESENGDFTYNCVGKAHIIDRDFSCHKKDGHGLVELKSAIKFSCNTFFYNIAIKTGAAAIRQKASALSFGSSIKICENLKTESGNLTSLQNLQSDAQIANFAIGQGDILLSPVNMLSLYLSIVNDGYYYLPSIVEGTIKDGKITKYDIGSKTYVFKKDTAKFLRESLREVVVSGTGTDANSEKVAIAGKTATAQTGKFVNGVELTNSWFCGFFPYDNPQYIGIVMSEGTSKVSTTEIFEKIAEKITENT